MKNLKVAYFAGEPLGVPILNELEKAGIMPELIVCNPDRPVGRKHILTAPPVKQWTIENNIEILQPETFNNQESGVGPLTQENWDLFVVVAYNHILPKWLIDLPKYGTINVHPSLLPLLRGASPIRTSILEDMREQCGVTIMQMDEKMDHGPILAQQTLEIKKDAWPLHGNELDDKLAQLGGQLLAQTIPKFVAGEIAPHEQAHEEATYCGRLDRSMGEITFDPYNLPSGDEASKILLKIRAYDGFPGTFFIHENKRIKITSAQLAENKLCIDRIIPEGKKEMDFEDCFNK